MKKLPSKQFQQILPRKVHSTTIEAKLRIQIRSRSRSNEVKFSKFPFSPKRGPFDAEFYGEHFGVIFSFLSCVVFPKKKSR